MKDQDVRYIPAESHPLGILLVHGVGYEERGETVAWAGEPIFRWLSRWVGKSEAPGNRVYLADTRLRHAIPSELDAPAFTEIFFQQGAQPAPGDPSWVMAESWWANEFSPPTFSDLAVWGLGIGPWMLLRSGLDPVNRLLDAMDRRWKVVREVINQRAKRNPIGQGLLLALWAFLYANILVSRFLLSLFGVAVVTIVGVLLQLFIILLLILTLVPQFQGFATSAQLALAAGLAGDAYLIASSPIRYNAMSSQVRRDIAWLAGTKGCRAIAVIAHSGGVPVAYEALKAPIPRAYLDKVRLFVSYGSGQGKLHAIEKILPNRGPFFAISPALLVGGSVGVLGGLLFSSQLSLFIGAAALILYLVLGSSRLNLTASGRLSDKELEEIKIGGYVPEPLAMPWKDYYASADPVSDGPIRDDKENPRSTRSTEIYNLNSILRDHSSYWENNEEFVTEVLRALYKIGDPGGTGTFASEEDDRHIIRSAVLRRNRVFVYLASGILSILSVPVLAFGFGRWVRAIGEFVRQPVTAFLPQGVVVTLDYWPYVLGTIVVALLVVLWQQTVLFPAWRFWGREETALLFEDYERETKHSDSLPFLCLSLIVPLIGAFGVLSGLFTGFATDGTLQVEVAGAIDFIPRLLKHDITDNLPLLVPIFTWVVVYVAVVTLIASLAIAGFGRWFISRNYRSVHNAEEEIAAHSA